ncbi:MAG: PD-(D/E)XK nuclease family protein [Bacteroidales bacterium]|nr:PD-(D/E)XK nuclease family protein [Bacteroidales bacterium]
MENISKSFLEKVARRLLQDYPENMQQACVIMPNRRATVFLKRHLSAILTKPAFGPSIFSIEDFVFDSVGFHEADQLELLWELYECYSKSGNTHLFEEFLKWGKVLLQDFEDVDMHLVDANYLFNYLSEAKAIELWNPGKSTLTEGQQRYLSFYRSLGELYTQFTQRLLEKRIAYKGLAFRYFVELVNKSADEWKWKHFYFAGFNALTPAEKGIIDSIEATNTLTRLFDADTYYVDDSRQEAGKYLREIARDIKPGKFEWVGNNLLEGSKNINVIGVPHNTGQVIVAASLLAEIKDAEAGNTAVVLNDESLLIPLLNAMPDNISHFNVTMGYPFSLTPVYGLMDILLNLHLHAFERKRKNSTAVEGSGKLRYYFRNVASLLKHPYIIGFLAVDGDDKHEPVISLLGSGKVFFEKDEILNHFNNHLRGMELLKMVFGDWSNAANAIENLLSINRLLAEAKSADKVKETSNMDVEYLYQFNLILNRLKLLTDRAGEELSLRGLHQLLKNIAAGTQLPFVGEPLRGVQIMGMLETRTLDFKNIIMLSVNEGVLPAGKHGNSFVPFDIRKETGLPVHSDRDAVFAYHFYRLLQRCDNMHLIYNSTPGELGGGEKSRFILQIEHELLKLNSRINYFDQAYSPTVRFDQAVKEISIAKTNDVQLRLAEMAQYGLSPTALSTFVSCPLKFYFSYVLRISEEDTTDDTMDASTFGSGIHDALKDLYEPYMKQPLTVAIIDAIAKEANKALHQNFLKAYKNNDLNYGKNLLMVKVAESFLRRFLQMEKEQIHDLERTMNLLTITAIEHEFFKEQPWVLRIEINGNQNFQVRLRGKADRIDIAGNVVRVIDYKTGSVLPKELKFDDWDQLSIDPEKGKSLQLLIYSYLNARENNTAFPEAGIISFRHLNEGFMGVTMPVGPTPVIEEIENQIRKLLQRIFDPALPFNQTTDLKNCEYCPFKGICNR